MQQYNNSNAENIIDKCRDQFYNVGYDETDNPIDLYLAGASYAYKLLETENKRFISLNEGLQNEIDCLKHNNETA